jgi:hypothetical protein
MDGKPAAELVVRLFTKQIEKLAIFCKAMSKLYASWAFFPRSAFFHGVP